MNDTKIIKINKLNHFYKEANFEKQVLFDLDLEIDAGETVLLTGESGSGKTTLLTLIGCLRSVHQGSLKIFGEELCNTNEEKRTELRRRIGYIFQHFNLLDCLTVHENIRISLELQANFWPEEASLKVKKILKEVGLEAKGNVYPTELSGGQKQRVAIARALVHNPSLVLADEPTAALDRQTGKEAISLIKRIAQQQGSAILIVTHDSRIFHFAERIIHMEDGRIGTALEAQLSLALPTLNDELLEKLISNGKEQTYSPDSMIITQGDIAEEFYIILEGTVEILQTLPDSAETIFIRTMSKNEFFGEIGLFTGKKRSATVRVTKDSEAKVLAISRDDFAQIMLESQFTYSIINQELGKRLEQDLKNSLRKKLSITLPTLTDDLLEKLISNAKELTYPSGSTIITQGDIAEEFYIILEGTVEILQTLSDSAETIFIKNMSKNEFFGEIGLFTGKKRSATVRVTNESEAKVLAISRDDFTQIMSKSELTHALINQEASKRLEENLKNSLRKNYQ